MDLAVSPPARPDIDRLVTYRFGGVAFHTPSPKPTLPLAIELHSISSSPGQPLVRVVEINIRNLGPGPYLLPVGRNGNVVLKLQNHGRREMRFHLRSRGDRKQHISGTQTFGSIDVPESLLAIAPGGIVLVRFAAHLESVLAEQWKAKGPAELEFEAGLTEWRYEDNPTEFVVNVTNAPEAFSKNAMTIRFQ